MLDLLRRGKRAAELRLERWRLRGAYTPTGDDTDVERHLREAAGWLARAQDFGADRGVAYGTRFGLGFLPSYPETTGYIIPTFLALADRYGDPDFERRAVEMGDWEIEVQMESGAVMGGRVDADPTPAVFNTGQVILGWVALHQRTGEDRFRSAAERAARWLVEIQEPDGNWVEGQSEFAMASASVYNVRVAWALALFGKSVGDDAAVEAGLRNAAFALDRQRDNGWFSDCCLTEPDRPLLHTLAYTMRGLLELGILCDREDLVAAARRTADAVLVRMRHDGFLPGCYRSDWSPAARWCCLTGSAQTSIVWSKLARRVEEDRYLDAADRVNRFVMARQDLTSADPAVRGGIPGSWPVWGEYGRFLILNWATKFFIDALLLAWPNEVDRATATA